MIDEMALKNTMRVRTTCSSMQFDSMLSENLSEAAKAILVTGPYEVYIEIKPVKQGEEDD